jgi:neuromedin U receptor 1
MHNNTICSNSSSEVDEWIELVQKSIVLRSEWIGIIFMISMFITFVVGVFGNLLTCVVIYCDRTMHTATNYYLFNLAVSDLLVAFGILLEVAGYLKGESIIEHEVGNIVCKVHFFLVVTLWNNGIMIMTALAIERYIAIWHPLLLTSRPVWRRVIKIIVLIWTIAILETLPEVWTVSLIKTSSFTCFIIPSTFAIWLNGILGFINFILPLTIMIFVYTMIAFKVNVTLHSNPKDKIFNQRNNKSKVNKLIGKIVIFHTILHTIFTGVSELISIIHLSNSCG